LLGSQQGWHGTYLTACRLASEGRQRQKIPKKKKEKKLLQYGIVGPAERVFAAEVLLH